MKHFKKDVWLVQCYECGKNIMDYQAKIGFPDDKGEFMCDSCWEKWKKQDVEASDMSEKHEENG